MNIAEKLIKLRKEKGITQENLSKKLNISISAIRNYENIKNPREPKNDILIKFANFYNVSTEYLLNDEINNKTEDNIAIENKLNLSDTVIEKIIKINKDNQYNVIEIFIKYIPENYWNILNRYIELNKREKAIKPLQDVLQYSSLLKKYATNDDLEIYVDFDEETNGGVINFNAYNKNNKCIYEEKDKEKILKCLDIIENNQALKENNFDDTEENYLMHKYDFSMWTVKKIINSNSYIPLSIVKSILSIPVQETKEIEAKKEVAKLSLYELSVNLLKHLENENLEAE